MSIKKADIKFGTDGWRGIINDNFTFDNVQRLTQAIAEYYTAKTQNFRKGAKIKIAVGYDTRFLSDKFAQAVSEVLSKNGIEVILSDRSIPTPALSFTIRDRKLTAGIMVTASHNPPEYNGIKIKTACGGAAGVKITNQIEKLLGRSARLPVCPSAGKIIRSDFTKDYIIFLRRYIDLKRLKPVKLKVLVDIMHGSGNGFIKDILKSTNIKLEFIRDEINPSFGGLRPEPVLENLGPSIERMKTDKFDVCLVLDGDADRIACLGPGGYFISPQKILGLLLLHLFRDKKMRGSVVKTIVGTTLIDKITKKLNLKLYETPVGFKYISALMEKEDILIGGEEAGGIGFKGSIPERDGTLAGLLFLEMMAYREKTIAEILKDMEKEFGCYYYLRQDLKIKNSKLKIQKFKKIKEILGKSVIKVKDYDGVKLICQDESWLMFRSSGTEPIVRIYAESKSLDKSRRLMQFGREKLGI